MLSFWSITVFCPLQECMWPRTKREAIHKHRTELSMVLLLNENKNEHRFPNVHMTLNIYMSASNCSGEQSYSKLKWIKKEVRSCMGQQRLKFLFINELKNWLKATKTLTLFRIFYLFMINIYFSVIPGSGFHWFVSLYNYFNK